jgi:hypothetical protein
MGLSIREMRTVLAAERSTMKINLDTIKGLRESVKTSRKRQKELREKLREEAKIRRVVKADARRLAKEQRDAKRAEKVAARIAKAEARLQALRDKANAPKQIRKNQRAAGPVKVYTAEEIAALNA